MAQVAINATGAMPDSSAILDVSSTTKGFLVPRLTTTQRNAIAHPAPGLTIYNTVTNCFNLWVGNTWKQICGDCDFNNPVVANNGPLCPGSNLVLSASTIPGGAYSWTGANGFTSTQQNPTIDSATSAAGGLYSLQVTLNGCTSTAVSTFVTVNSSPATPIASNNGPACPNGTINLASSTVLGAFYNWTGPNGFSSTAQNPVITNMSASDTGVYTVYATANGCPSATSSTTVSLYTLPVATFTPTSTTVNTPTTFFPTVSGATYSWVFNNGTPASSTDPSPSVTWTNSGSQNVTLTVTRNGCSQTTTTSITVQLPAGCARATDNTVWCVASDNSTTGAMLCGYPVNYSGTYYQITNAGATALGMTVTGYGDCATNYTQGNTTNIQGWNGSNCWSTHDEWARNGYNTGTNYFPVVRCTDYE